MEIVPNLLYRENITLVAGTRSGEKTSFTAAIAQALASGSDSLWDGKIELEPIPRRVLWMAFNTPPEDVYATVKNCYGGCTGDNLLFARGEEHPPLTDETVQLYHNTIREYGIDVLIVDTVRDWFGRKNNYTRGRAKREMDRIRRVVKDTGCAVLATLNVRDLYTFWERTNTVYHNEPRVVGMFHPIGNGKYWFRWGDVVSGKWLQNDRFPVEFKREGLRFIPRYSPLYFGEYSPAPPRTTNCELITISVA